MRLLVLFLPVLLGLIPFVTVARGIRGRGLEAVAVSPDGKIVAVGGANRVVYLLKPEGPKGEWVVRQRFWLGSKIAVLTFFQGGDLLVADDTDTLHRLNLTAGPLSLSTLRSDCRGLVVGREVAVIRDLQRDKQRPAGTRLLLLSLRDGKELGAIEVKEQLVAWAPTTEGPVVTLTLSTEGVERRVPAREVPLTLTGLARRTFLQKHDGRESRLQFHDPSKKTPLREFRSWYTSDSENTLLFAREQRAWVLNHGNNCARIDLVDGRTSEITLFETELTFNQALAFTPDRRRFAAGGLGDAWMGPIPGGSVMNALEGKTTRWHIPPLPGADEVVQAFHLNDDGTGWAVTSAYRLVRLGIEPAGGKVEALVPVY